MLIMGNIPGIGDRDQFCSLLVWSNHDYQALTTRYICPRSFMGIKYLQKIKNWSAKTYVKVCIVILPCSLIFSLYEWYYESNKNSLICCKLCIPNQFHCWYCKTRKWISNCKVLCLLKSWYSFSLSRTIALSYRTFKRPLLYSFTSSFSEHLTKQSTGFACWGSLQCVLQGFLLDLFGSIFYNCHLQCSPNQLVSASWCKGEPTSGCLYVIPYASSRAALPIFTNIALLDFGMYSSLLESLSSLLLTCQRWAYHIMTDCRTWNILSLMGCV